MKRQIEKLKDLITIDFLTKLYNRWAFSNFLQRACQEIKWSAKHKTRRQQKTQFSLFLIDIDTVFN